MIDPILEELPINAGIVVGVELSLILQQPALKNNNS